MALRPQDILVVLKLLADEITKGVTTSFAQTSRASASLHPLIS